MFTLNRVLNNLKEVVTGQPIAPITTPDITINSICERNLVDSEPVILHIYSVSERVNRFSSMFGLGLYHTAVEVYGQEHSFAAHPFKFTGIISTIPKTAPYVYQEGLNIGRTKLNEQDIGNCLKELGKVFNGNSYHLLYKK